MTIGREAGRVYNMLLLVDSPYDSGRMVTYAGYKRSAPDFAYPDIEEEEEKDATEES